MFMAQYKSAALFRICFFNKGDCILILFAALNPSLAWSNIVATLYICGAPSLSFISMSSSMAAVSVVLPFFLPSIINTSLYCLKLLSSTNPKMDCNLAFWKSSNRRGCPNFPVGNLQNRSINSIWRLAISKSKWNSPGFKYFSISVSAIRFIFSQAIILPLPIPEKYCSNSVTLTTTQEV